MTAEQRLANAGIELPPAPKAIGVYRSCVVFGNLCFTSGHGPLKSDGQLIVGCVGDDLDMEAGYAAARQTGLSLLATLRAELGSLDRVKRVIKLLGMVRCTPDFHALPSVINGCSELFAEVFGQELGVGARSAVGLTSLPMGMAVEIEGIFEVED